MPDISKLVLEIDSNGVVKASGNLDVFSRKAREAGEQAEGAEKKAKGFDEAIRLLSPSSLAAAAGLSATVVAFGKITNALTGFAKGSLSAYASFEQIESGLQGVLKSEEAGTRMFEELREFSNSTTFGVDSLAEATTQLVSIGESTETVKDKLLQIGNIAGGDTQKFKEIVSIYAKIQNVGKAGSEQLQQLALRQIPIYQYLKKIGVQGAATGDDIKNAFEEMTKEGEIFHGTMDRINRTMEGKKSFLSDSLREASVLFVEVSEAGDLYKSMLDKINDALKIAIDFLKKVDENPVYSALLKGSMAAGVSALTVAVGIGLVGAVKNLNKNLAITATLKSVINPTALAVGALTAAVVGGTVAIASYISNQQKENAEFERLNKTLEETVELKKTLASINLGSSSDEMQSVIDANNTIIEGKETYIEKYIKRNEKIKDQLESIRTDYANAGFKFDDEDKEISELNPLYAKLLREKASINKAITELKSANSSLESENAKFAESIGYNKEAEKNTDYLRQFQDETSAVVKLRKLYEEYAKVKEMAGLKVYDEKNNLVLRVSIDQSYKSDIENAMQYIQSQIDDLNFKIFKDGMEDWQKALSQMFGLDDNDLKMLMKKGEGGKGLSYLSLYSNDLEKSMRNMERFYENAGWKLSEKDKNSSLYNSYREIYEGLAKDVNFSADDNVSKGVSDKIRYFRDELEKLGVEFDEAGRILDESADEVEKWSLADAIIGSKSKITSKFGEIGSLLDSSIDTVALGIKTAFSEDKTAGIDQMKTNIVSSVMDFVGWLIGYMLDRNKEEEQVKDLTSEYRALLDAMKDTEEYYLERKRELMAQDYASGVTNVHDMILTPQGKFSTDPDDFIIASKHPESLGSGGAVVNMSVSIVNEISDRAEVSAERTTDEEGNEQLMLRISQKVACDYMNGDNGWDSAVAYRDYKSRGRNVVV